MSNARGFPARWILLLSGTVLLGGGCGRTSLLARGDAVGSDRRRDDAGAAPDSAEGLRLVAGHLGGSGWVDGIGAAARFYGPNQIASDGVGHLFATSGTTIRRVVIATGEVTTLAGSPGHQGSADGTGVAASFSSPAGIASDGAGNLFVADTYDSTIRRVVVATGEVSTLAGSAGQRGHSDGVGAAARFGYPLGIASDGKGRLFVTDANDLTIRSVVIATGEVTTLAGSPGEWGDSDGIGSAARFGLPASIVADPAGRLLFVLDSENHTIRQVVIATGTVTTLARWFIPELSRVFDDPNGIASDGAGNLFVTIGGQDGAVVQRVVIATGEIKGFAGSAGQRGGSDGIGAAARFDGPHGIASDGAGNLFVGDAGTVRKIVIATGEVTTFAGTGSQAGSNDGTGAAARFNFPQGIASDGSGNVFVADSDNLTIRKVVIATGEVTTLAGSPGQTGSRDGVGTAARFNFPQGIESDGSGNVFVVDSYNCTIRKVVIATGEVTTFAGSPEEPGHIDGTGAAARFDNPTGMASDGAGNLFVADPHTIRKVVIATGEVTTLAGSPKQNGHTDGTGAAARFTDPYCMASDGAGNLFVADGDVIRQMVIATGEVTTLAGSPGSLDSADGVGANAHFSALSGIVHDGNGNLFVADNNCTIRKVVVSTRTVTTVVGTPGRVGVVLGALPAGLTFPRALALGPAGELLISDIEENVILAVRL